MTCREFAEFIDSYLAGRLPAEQRAAFQRHLAICGDCVSYLDSYRRTVDLCLLLRDADDSVPADVPEDLIAAILQSSGKNT